MKRILPGICLALLLTVMLSGCGGAAAPGTAGGKLPELISIATANPGAITYTVAVGESQVLKKYLGIRVAVESLTIKQDAEFLKAGQIEFVSDATSDIVAAYVGLKGIGYTAPHARLVAYLFPNRNSFVVRGDLGVKTMKDLKGLRGYVIRSDYPNSIEWNKGMLATGGLTFDDIKTIQHTSSQEAVDGIIEGRGDFVSTSATSSRNLALHKKYGAYVVPVPPEKFDLVHQYAPGLVSAVVLKGEQPWITVDTPVIGEPQALWTGASVSEELVYQVTKAILEHPGEITVLARDVAGWTPKAALKNLGFPFHPGAIRYYKEKGWWTQEWEQQQQALLKKAAK